MQNKSSMRLHEITSNRVRAIITGSPTPASDILAIYNELPELEAFQARAYFATIDGDSILGHARREQSFMRANDI